MNTPNFITLPSGLRVNTAHIIHYGQSEHYGQIKIILTDEPTPWMETMALFEMDALLQPQGTPIVSPIPSEQSISFDKPFQFTFEGSPKHGLIDGFGYNMIDGSYIRILSDGDAYNFLMSKGVTVKV